MVKSARPSRIGSLAVLAAASACAPASAGTVTGTMAVSLPVEEACNLDVRPLSFGTLGSGATRADADTSLGVACTPETAFTVSMDDGQHRADGRRRMATASGEYISYDLYSDAARTRRWGASLTEAVGGQVAGGSAVTLPIYGRIETAAAGAGAYSDVVTVTVSF